MAAAASSAGNPECEWCGEDSGEGHWVAPSGKGVICHACWQRGEAPRVNINTSADTRTAAETATCCACKQQPGVRHHMGDATHLYCAACWEIESNKSLLWCEIRAIRDARYRERAAFFESIHRSYVRMAHQSILLAVEMDAPQAKVMMAPEHAGMTRMLYYHLLDHSEFKDCCDIKTLCEDGREALVFTLKR